MFDINKQGGQDEEAEICYHWETTKASIKKKAVASWELLRTALFCCNDALLAAQQL